jgi:hypothetical protein
MLIKRLNEKHPDHNGDLWRDYMALYEGGHKFRERAKRFLTQNPSEPHEVYQQRIREACYRAYIGTVCDYFAALLFATPLLYSAKVEGSDTKIETPDWAQDDLEGDADGKGTDLVEFLRSRVIDAMVKRCAFWRLDFPANYGTGTDKADADRSGATDVRLIDVQREDVLDWECDERGNLLWIIIAEKHCPRPTPSDERNVIVHRWWVLDREKVELYEAVVRKGEILNEEHSIQPIRSHRHTIGEVPIVRLDVGPGLWVANRLESPQLEHFRLTSANNWSMRRTCYAMPVFSVKEPDNFAPSAMGAGYYLTIGVDETMTWAAPPVAHLSVVRDEIDAQKDELFRIVTQMSLGVDNNAAAIGRSAESKIADADAIQVVLRAYGSKVRDALRDSLNMLSKARGEALTWDVEGLDKFETLPPDVLIELLAIAIDLRIPSKTWLAEVKSRVALALTPGLARNVKEEVREEIEEGVQNEDGELHEAIAALTRPDEDDPDGSAEGDGSGAAPGGAGRKARTVRRRRGAAPAAKESPRAPS